MKDAEYKNQRQLAYEVTHFEWCVWKLQAWFEVDELCQTRQSQFQRREMHSVTRTRWNTVNRRSITSTSNTFNPPTYQSKRYSPTIKPNQNQNQHKTAHGEGEESCSSLLVRAGFVRQSSSGIWSFLPNGLRVIKKIQSIVSREMEQIGPLYPPLCFLFLFFHRSINWSYQPLKSDQPQPRSQCHSYSPKSSGNSLEDGTKPAPK